MSDDTDTVKEPKLDEIEKPDYTEVNVVKEKETTKKEVAHLSITQIQNNLKSILTVVQIQLTQVLLNLQNIEKDVEEEMAQFWVKELPIRTQIQSYLRAISDLINLYNQQEAHYKKAFEEIFASVEYPDFYLIEEKYITEINKAHENIEFMQKEVEKYKIEVEEQFETDKIDAIKKAKQKIHLEYEEVLTECEIELDNYKEKVDKLEKLSLGREKKDTKNESEMTVSEILAHKKEAVYKEAETPKPTSEDKKIPKKILRVPIPMIAAKEAEVRDEVLKKIANKIIVDGKNYQQIKKELSKEYSSSSFYKYLNELIELGIIIKEGTGKVSTIKIIPSKLRELKEEGDTIDKDKKEV